MPVSAPIIGEELKTTNGKWKNLPTSFTYQWVRCNSSGTSPVNISSATASKYTVASADNEHTIRVTVTAINSYGSTASTSEASGIVGKAPEEENLPEIEEG